MSANLVDIKQPSNPMLDAALAYAKRGWPVFPCAPGNKHPITENGLLDASSDPSVIQQWWRQNPKANIGLVTGIASGLVVVDVDVSDDKQGADSLMGIKPAGWETLTSVTWSGGWHYFLQHPKTGPISNRVNALPGIDIRGDGGYVIAPPSVVKGKTYRWSTEIDPAEMDTAAKSLMRSRVPDTGVDTPDSDPIRLTDDQVARIRKALAYIDPDPYDDWIRTGMALYEMSGGSEQAFTLWNHWSAQSGKYVGDQMQKRWRSFASNSGGKITEATLWKMATDKGFYEPVTSTLTLGKDFAAEGIQTTAEPPSIDEFMAYTFPKDDPILGAFNANQIVNLIGPTGLGKSNLTLHILNAMSRGTDALGWKSHKKVPVLYVDGEMGGSQLQDRFTHYNWEGADFSVVNAINWCSINALGHPNLSHTEWQDLIIKWAPPGGVVALDNLMSLVHVPGTSLSSDEFWRVVTPLNLRLRALGCTVIWVDHTNSEGKIFGTKTKEWQSDLVLTLMNNEKTEEFDEKPGTAFTLAFTKVRGERGEQHTSLDIQMTPDKYAGLSGLTRAERPKR